MNRVLLSKFHLKGDGVSDDGEALQRALNERPPLLEIPDGQYNVGRTLRIFGGTHLRLTPGATLRLADGAATREDDYLLTNAGSEANAPCADADIAIEGGLWDGNNAGNPRPEGLFAGGYSGAMLHFQNVAGLRLERMRLHNAEAYHARFTHVRDFHIEDIQFSAERIRPNNDGIHLGGHCERGVIRGIRGAHPGVTGDDLVALNADDALTRTEVRGMTCGPIRDVRIEDLEAEGCHSFVRLLSVFSPIENVRIRRVRGTCGVAALNADAARGCRVPLFDEANPPFADGVGELRDIELDDFHVAKSAPNGVPLLRLETRMSRFAIKNFRRDTGRDMDAGQPTLGIRGVQVRQLFLRPGEAPVQVAVDGRFELREGDIPWLAVNPEE